MKASVHSNGVLTCIVFILQTYYMEEKGYIKAMSRVMIKMVLFLKVVAYRL